MPVKKFLLHSNNIQKDSYLWNMIGSMLNAFQSVIMLMILTRAVSLYEAGVFTIAYANANLFLNIGKYGMRNYQVSDVHRSYSFKDYKYSRLISSFAMMLTAIVYIIIASTANHYPSKKTWIILWMCLFKLVDSVEDVYHGLYQQQNRLDIAGKMMSLRMFITILLFGISLVVTRDLLISLIATTLVTALIFVWFIADAGEMFDTKSDTFTTKKMIDLFKKCFPLFVGTFLAFYIGNAPKYAIDSLLNDELQACYGFIAMPVFVIGLLNNFVFNPVIADMSRMWDEKKYIDFKRQIKKQISIVTVITVVCEAGAYLIGIPVLSILYNTDLSAYKTELLVLLLGGGFFALSGLLVTILTILRHQNGLAIGYTVTAIFALCLAHPFVKAKEIMGASVLYLLLMILLCIIFSGLLIYYIKREAK